MILRFGIGIILKFLLVFFVASFYIKYPTYETVPLTLVTSGGCCDVTMPVDGVVADVNVCDGEYVKTNDSLMVAYSQTPTGIDTCILRSPSSGIVYARDFFRKGETVRQGAPLFVIRSGNKEKLTGKCYVSQQVKQKITAGTVVECVRQEAVIHGKITKIAEVMNPLQNGFAVEILFEDGISQDGSRHSFSAKFKTSDKTIFELFFFKSMLPSSQ